MAEFINTIDALGDDAVIDSIIDKSITEFKDNIVTSVGDYAFSGCKQLVNVDMPALNYTPKRCFLDCTNVENFNLPSVTSISDATFEGCGSKVKTLVLPKCTSLFQGSFTFCYIKTIDFHKLTTIANSIFYKCSLTTLVLRSETMCSLGVGTGSAFYWSGVSKVLVPSSLVDSYKVATNWSEWADKFRALEDYTVDGTITGELDETKI